MVLLLLNKSLLFALLIKLDRNYFSKEEKSSKIALVSHLLCVLASAFRLPQSRTIYKLILRLQKGVTFNRDVNVRGFCASIPLTFCVLSTKT